MSRAFGALLILWALCSPAILRAQEGSLQKIRQDVKRGDNSKNNRSNPDNEESDNAIGALLASLLGLLMPGCDDNSCHEDGYFPKYPYAAGQPGYMWLRRTSSEDDEPAAQPDFNRARGWSGRVAVEESNDFNGINRASLRLLIETGRGLGVQTNWSHVHESLRCGCTEEAALGDVNVTYLFLQDEYVQMRAGVGARMISDRYNTDFGVNFTLGADVFPCRPIVLTTTIDGGTLGQTSVFRAQASIGFLHKRWEIYTGYDYLRIGSTALQGPTLGLRLWF